MSLPSLFRNISVIFFAVTLALEVENQLVFRGESTASFGLFIVAIFFAVMTGAASLGRYVGGIKSPVALCLAGAVLGSVLVCVGACVHTVNFHVSPAYDQLANALIFLGGLVYCGPTVAVISHKMG